MNKINIIDFVDKCPDVPESVEFYDIKTGVCCLIKQMSVDERDEFELAQTKRTGIHLRKKKISDEERIDRWSRGLRARYLCEVIVDDKRQQIYSGEQGMKKLGKLPSSVGTKIYDFAMDLNNYTEEDFEELEKN